jgi:uncharacterized protein YbcI
MGSLTHSAPAETPARRSGLCRGLNAELQDFFAHELGVSGPMETHVVDDLIIVRCKRALSPAEVSIGATKAGRLLVKEVTEKVCKKLEPGLDRLLLRATGVTLHELRVGLFWKRGEKVFLLHMGEKINAEMIQK